jgi:hypothetical protein
MQYDVVVELNDRDAAGKPIVQTLEAQLVSGSALDSRLWMALFPEAMFVRPFVFDQGEFSQPQKTHPLALPERNLYRFAVKESVFQYYAVTNPATTPQTADLLPRLELAGVIHRVAAQPSPGVQAYQVQIDKPVSTVLGIRDKLMKQEINKLMQVQPRGTVSQEILTTVPKMRALEQVQAVTQNQFTDRHLEFFEYQAWAQRVVAPAVARRREPTPQERDWARNLDFHQIVASLADYPEILKRLGLRLDFQVPERALQKPGKMSLRVKDPAIASHVIAPKTEYILTRGFHAKADETSGLQEGFLPFGRMETVPVRDIAGKIRSISMPVFDVVPGDVEGAVAKMANFAEQLLSPEHLRTGAPDTIFPALRSAGLAVAHSQRDRWLQVLLLRSTQIHAGLTKQDPNLVLRMEDLIRGFRIDVREVRRVANGTPQFGPWRSLCERQATYALSSNQPALFTASDEGWVALGLTQGQSDPVGASGQTVAPRVVRLYESLFRWSGWSLCVPRIGKPVASAAAPAGPAASGFTLQVNLSPIPGSLLRLRFGRQYQFRARLVDLAGNSVALSDPMVNLSNPVVTSDLDGYYDRFEPVSAPVILLTSKITGNPSPNFPNGEPIAPGESSTRLVIRTINLERRDELAAQPANPVTARHIVPPKISQELAEAHGMFDNPQTKNVSGSDAYRLMIQKDRPLSDDDSSDAVRPDPFVVVPYLPDPMTAGAAFFQLPGLDQRTGAMWLQPFEGAWPEKRSFRLQLEAGQAAPQFQNGILRASVPPGEQRTVQLSSYLPANGENLFGIWRWIQEKLRDGQPGSAIESLRTLVRQGRHWMISPAREIVLVHATQQPWLTPLWVFLDCARQLNASQVQKHRRVGETVAPLLGTVAIHRASTEKFSVEAEWREPVDQGTMQEQLSAWLYITGRESVFEQSVTPPPDPGKPQIVTRSILPGMSASTPAADIPLDSVEIPRFPDDLLPVAAPGTSPESTSPTEQDTPPAEEPQSRATPGLFLNKPSSGALLQQQGVVPPAPAPAPAPPPKIAPPVTAQELEKVSPILKAATPAAPTPTAPPYDETPYRCAKPPSNLAPAGYGERLAFAASHRFHDTKYRCLTYITTATTRYRDYFRPRKDESKENMPRFTRTSPPIQVDILSSAQPDAPKVIYVIPTFKWESAPQGRRRLGGGLRVYLDRPWFSSGDGEQLAVVLYPDATADLPDYAVPVVTQWGLDPLWEPGPSRLPPGVIEKPVPGIIPQVEGTPKVSPAPAPSLQPPLHQLNPRLQQIIPRGIEEPDDVTSRAAPLAQPLDPLKTQLLLRFGIGISHPSPSHFRNAVAVRHDLGIEEVRLPPSPVQARGLEQAATTMRLRDTLLSAASLWSPPLPVTICAFDVKPDPVRQLWYCDIEMDPGTAYFPFVRLALARYQVNSVPHAHLSPVVQADFVQLVPDRACSIVRAQDAKDTFIVSVVGTTANIGQTRSAQVEISLEERNTNLPEELGWAAVPSSTVVLNRIDQEQWQGKLHLPAATAGKVFRTVIREYEIFRGNEADTGRTEERRLVFAAALAL